MTETLLVTGPPSSGKTTVIHRVSERLESRGYQAGGIYCPELRADGDRVGFEIVDVITGESEVLARVEYDEGPQVGKYRENIVTVDSTCAAALQHVFDDADFLIVDKIAPMALSSSG